MVPFCLFASHYTIFECHFDSCLHRESAALKSRCYTRASLCVCSPRRWEAVCVDKGPYALRWLRFSRPTYVRSVVVAAELERGQILNAEGTFSQLAFLSPISANRLGLSRLWHLRRAARNPCASMETHSPAVGCCSLSNASDPGAFGGGNTGSNERRGEVRTS